MPALTNEVRVGEGVVGWNGSCLEVTMVTATRGFMLRGSIHGQRVSWQRLMWRGGGTAGLLTAEIIANKATPQRMIDNLWERPCLPCLPAGEPNYVEPNPFRCIPTKNIWTNTTLHKYILSHIHSWYWQVVGRSVNARGKLAPDVKSICFLNELILNNNFRSNCIWNSYKASELPNPDRWGERLPKRCSEEDSMYAELIWHSPPSLQIETRDGSCQPDATVGIQETGDKNQLGRLHIIEGHTLKRTSRKWL